MTKRLQIVYDFGEALGYAVDSSELEFLRNYFSKHCAQPDKVLKKIPASCVALLQMIKVNWEYQGLRYGKRLLTEFESKCLNALAKAVVLVADDGEVQRRGFDLVSFYKRNGYTQIAASESGPIMVKVFAGADDDDRTDSQ